MLRITSELEQTIEAFSAEFTGHGGIDVPVAHAGDQVLWDGRKYRVESNILQGTEWAYRLDGMGNEVGGSQITLQSEGSRSPFLN